jgi:hypothetical protein
MASTVKVMSASQIKAIVDRERASFDRDVQRQVGRTVDVYTPRRTGALRASARIAIEVSRDRTRFDITYTAPYSAYVNDGTGLWGPHRTRILAKGRAMRWPAGGMRNQLARALGQGGYVFARSTKGQPGQHYIERILTDPGFAAYLQQRANLMFRRISEQM